MVTLINSRLASIVQGRDFLAIMLFCYAGLLVFASIFPAGLSSSHFNVILTDTPAHMANVFGFSDAGSYLKASLELNNLDKLTPNQHWVINLWPPGMVLLNASIIHLFGDSYAMVYSILIAVIWTLLSWYFALEVKKKFGSIVSFLSLSFLVLASPLQTWVFDSGLFYAEGISVAAFLMALIFLSKGLNLNDETDRLGHAIFAGIFIAIAAYFRSTFSTLETGLFVLVLLLAIRLIVLKLRNSAVAVKKIRWAEFRFFGVAWLAAFSLMEPWLQFTQHFIRGMRAWSVVGGGFFRNAWVERSTAADFVQAGGIGWACEIDPDLCLEISKFESETGTAYPIIDLVFKTIWTIISNPFDYLADRAHFLSTGWLSSEASMGVMSVTSGLVLLLLFAFVFSKALKSAFKGNVASLYVLFCCFLLVAPMMVGHVEPRYFIPLKLLFVLYPWLSGSGRKISN